MSHPEQSKNMARSKTSQATRNRVALHRAGSASELEGYKAAAIVIERMLDKAQAKRPKRQGNRKSAAYRAGYYDALLYAHCVLVWGEYPNHPSNLAQIRKIIQRPNS